MQFIRRDFISRTKELLSDKSDMSDLIALGRS